MHGRIGKIGLNALYHAEGMAQKPEHVLVFHLLMEDLIVQPIPKQKLLIVTMDLAQVMLWIISIPTFFWKFNFIQLYQSYSYTSNFCHVLVDGAFSEWDDWTECSVSCGGGGQTRSRRCDNPAPQFGGLECVGELTECQECNIEPCASQCPAK